MTLATDEFIRRFLIHVLPRDFHRIRHYGLVVRAVGTSGLRKMIWGSTLISNEVGPMIFDEFLPNALADGRYVGAPAVEIVGHGLAAIPAALERQRRGVSATKLVVTL